MDTNLKSIRKDYLHIEAAKTVKYSIKATEIKRYSIDSLIEIAKQDFQEYTEEENKERAGGSFGLTLPITTNIFTAGVITMVRGQQAYLRKLNELSEKLEYIIGFNLEVSSSVADEHVEIIVSSSDSARLKFGVRLLPSRPSRYNYEIPDISQNFSTRDQSEFYATFNKDKGYIKSYIEKINGNHPKLLFDEDAFAIIASGQDFFEVEVKVFSKILPKPQVNKVKIKKIDSVLEQLK